MKKLLIDLIKLENVNICVDCNNDPECIYSDDYDPTDEDLSYD